MLTPLYTLLQKDTSWKWQTAQVEAFQQSKDLLTSSSVLIHYNPDYELTLACDASQYGLGAVLSHRLPNGDEKPIAYASRTLSKAERNYLQLEKEGLALVFGVQIFHLYLYGREFTYTQITSLSKAYLTLEDPYQQWSHRIKVLDSDVSNVRVYNEASAREIKL